MDPPPSDGANLPGTSDRAEIPTVGMGNVGRNRVTHGDPDVRHDMDVQRSTTASPSRRLRGDPRSRSHAIRRLQGPRRDVLVDEVADGGWGIGGGVLTRAMLEGAGHDVSTGGQ
jgi:hypothetical protein